MIVGYHLARENLDQRKEGKSGLVLNKFIDGAELENENKQMTESCKHNLSRR